jgi:hypothetical protein
LRHFGTTDISQKLLLELRQKTTSQPFKLPSYMQINSDMILSPQVARYTNGAPDIGYWYDALDYTVANVTLAGGNVTVEPGTAIAVRNEYLPNTGAFTIGGFMVSQGSAFISQGTPTKPNTFTSVRMVQETPETDFSQFELDEGYWFGTVLFVPDFQPKDPSSPTLNFRFCRFYLPPNDYQIWLGLQEFPAFDGFDFEMSPDSAVYLTFQDCALYGGRVNLGNPDYYYYPIDYVYAPGTVIFGNNLFDQTSMNLDPTYYEYGVDDDGLNVDLALQSYNNLFRGGQWLAMSPIPASAGNWTFNDNLFDKVDFIQNTSEPLDFACDAYWPKTSSELFWPGYDASQLLPTTTGDGFTDSTNEPVFTTPPPHQWGPFGNHYMPTNTILYHVGSRTADAAGFCQYTTRVDQTKEAVGQTVDIGLHYVAASSSPTGWVPMDTDGDGIPDYVENWHGDGNPNGQWDTGIETDWRIPDTYTDASGNPLPDSLSSVYNDIDLSGDGLTGALDAFLGITNTLLPDNPLSFALAGLSTVSNTVQFDLALGPNLDTNGGVILLTVDGVMTDTSVYETNGQWIAIWDTTEIANGLHEVDFQIQLWGDDYSTTVSSTFVTVRNVVSFPNFYPLAGSTIFVAPETLYAKGAWQMDVYDDQSNLFASLAGPVDANGFCDDPDTLQPGITISIVDDQGNQLPSAYYTILLTVFPAADPPPVTLQRRVQVEKPWASYPGEWVVAYQPLFDPNSASGITQSRSLAASTDYIANTAPFNNNSILSSPLTAGGNVPMILGNLENQNWTPGYNGAVQWSSLTTILSEKTPGQNARNLYMFCHFCNGQYLGGTANPSWGISLERLNNSILLNGPNLLDPVLSHTNRHPYRFVFIDGCESANGNLASAFGIPLLQTNYLAWTNLAIPARDFVGWKNVKIGRSFNALPNQDHLIYIRSFFDLWSSFNQNTGSFYTLQHALRDADLPVTYNNEGGPDDIKGQTHFYNDIQIWGVVDLQFNQ